MLFKNTGLICGLIGSSLLLMPIMATAGLTITNNTAQNSTTIINSTCSTSIGTQGVTHPHSTNEVPDMAIRMVCYTTPNHCVADVRMTADCSGESMATIVYDINSGVKAATLSAAGVRAGYQINGGGYAIQFNGGPRFYTAK